ncbi:MAG: AsmA family protein, partial [Gammaproteobacteria bacterium]
LDPLRLRFDDTTLEGNLRLPSFEGPKVRYRLSLDTIDLDRYLPPKEKSVEGKQAPAPQAATPGQAAAGAAAELPLESLRRLDLDGTLTIGELKAFQLRSRNITLTTRASGGKIRLHPASAELYEGKYEGDFRLDVRGRQPAFSMNEKVIAIQAGPLLRDLTGKAAMTGRGEVQVKLTGKGLDPEQIKPTLNGHLSLSFRDGAIAGIDIPRMIREAQARLKGQTLPAANGPGQTDFTSLTATAAVKEGVLLNDDLRLQSPLLRAAGRGKVDLPRNRIDYLLTVKLVGTLEGEGGKPMESLRGLAIPLRIQGPLPSPRYRVELDRVLKKTVERKVRKRLEKHLLPQLQKRFGDRLEGLFGR